MLNIFYFALRVSDPQAWGSELARVKTAPKPSLDRRWEMCVQYFIKIREGFWISISPPQIKRQRNVHRCMPIFIFKKKKRRRLLNWYRFGLGKFPLKIPNFEFFSHQVKKNCFGSDQKVPRSKPGQALIYCGSKIFYQCSFFKYLLFYYVYFSV